MNKLFDLNAADCIRLTELFLSIQAALSCLESLYHRSLYKPANLLDWKFIKEYRSIFRASASVEKGFDALFSYPAVLILFGLRLLTAIFILYSLYAGRQPSPAVLLLCLLGLLASLRHAYSDNGSDQLANIVLMTLSINILTGNAGPTRGISIVFIAFQASLAYLTAGIFKATNANWRNGQHLQGILSTEVFGNGSLKHVLDGVPYAYQTVSATLILSEISLGVSPFLPPGPCLVILGVGALFHFGVALIMGFNTFFWTFLATYPAIYFVAGKLH
jgi:hypothetical protein